MTFFSGKTNILLFTCFVLCFGLFGFAKAGADDNVSGWAWSENIGWISFNNITGGGAVDYGVSVDYMATNIFSGYAWSENAGWITFNQSDLSGCPSGTCRAEIDTGTNQISGWAKILSITNGWISLRGADYGILWNPVTQEMEGWAWSDSIGWISFNSETGGGATDYAVLSAFGNEPVCLSLSAAPEQGPAPLSVLFAGTGQDSDGTIVDYGFVFGDSGSSTTTSSSTSHIYNNPGVYCAKLRVRDNDGIWSALPESCPAVCAKQIVVAENDPPLADIGCDASGCLPGGQCGASWIAYNRNCQYYFLNNATDENSTNPPDNNNDISKSTWSIFYGGGSPWQDPYVVCTDNPSTPENEGICDLLMPSLPASQTYLISLTVEDKGGLTDDYSHSFYVRRELAADFQCSTSPDEGWQACGAFVASEDELVYFKDISVASEGSGGISSWSWTFEDGDPATSNEQYPSSAFKNIDSNSGTVVLDVTDTSGRSDSQQYELFITIPLPEWWEIAPF